MICFKKVTKQLDDYKSVRELYFSAFPAVERVPFWLLMKKSKKPKGSPEEIFNAAVASFEDIGIETDARK